MILATPNLSLHKRLTVSEHTLALFSALDQRGPRILKTVFMVALAAGIGLWSALLLAPKPEAAPPALAAGPAVGQDITPVLGWFGGGSARLRVTVVGLIASGERGAALLSINGGSPEAYRVGQTLAQGVTLSAVSPSGVSIDQDGIIEEVFIAATSPLAQGFVPVPVNPSR